MTGYEDLYRVPTNRVTARRLVAQKKRERVCGSERERERERRKGDRIWKIFGSTVTLKFEKNSWRKL